MSSAKQRSRYQAKKERIAARLRFQRARIAEKKFARQLSGVARQVDTIVKGFTTKQGVTNPSELNAALHRYSDILKPWAQAVSEKLVTEVSQRDLHAWNQLGNEIGRGLRAEMKNAPTGQLMKQMMAEQVDLITSLPRQAAQRVHELVIESMGSGARSSKAVEEILRTGKVTKSRAVLIAHTETGRSATALIEARSRFVGSDGYIWRTSGDGDVREQHKKLNGKFIHWDKPPVAGSNGQRYHAGAGPNCRCIPEPVIP